MVIAQCKIAATLLRTRGNTVKNYELNMFGNQMFLTNELNIWRKFVEKLFSERFWIYKLIFSTI